MTRSRLVLLFAPFLLIVLVVATTIVAARAVRGDLPADQARGIVAAIRPASQSWPCRGPGITLLAGPTVGTNAAGRTVTGPATHAVGAWWRREPELDASGQLTGWRLVSGAPGVAATVRSLPVESSVSGPESGRLVLSSDDGTRSTVEVLNVATGCRATIDVGPGVARGAVADPAAAAVLVHLVERGSRTDLGTWRVDGAGRRTSILPPVPGEALLGAGIARVWATNLAVTADGSRVAVQSCDPGACVTRVVDPRTGAVRTLAGTQGDLVGFAGDRLITRATCPGLPCPVLAWDAGRAAPTMLEAAAVGAAVSTDGSLVLTLGDGTETRAVAIDPSTGDRWAIGQLETGTIPVGATSGLLGIEAGAGRSGFVDAEGRLSVLDIAPLIVRDPVASEELLP
jgi:hypothetical protein